MYLKMIWKNFLIIYLLIVNFSIVKLEIDEGKNDWLNRLGTYSKKEIREIKATKFALTADITIEEEENN